MKRRLRGRLGAVLLAMAAPLGAQPAADIAGTGLPADDAVRRALQESPRLRIASEYVASGQAQRQRLRAGPHEWEIDTLSQQRKDVTGATHNEIEYGLSTGVRWPWKYTLDRRLGDLAREVGELAYSDAWHEAGRDLLDLWFAWVHGERLSVLLERQSATVQAQRDAVARRVAAGDAAPLELQLAEAETARLRAARSIAQRDTQLARQALAREFPDLPQVLPETADAVAALPGDDAAWIAHIVADNHEIELAERKRDEARAAADRAARDRFADPVIGLHYTDNLGGERRVIGLSVRLPLGGSGRTADAALARSAARTAEGEAQRATDYVNAAARSAVADARQSLASWRDQQAAFLAQQAAAETTAKGYALGEFDIDTLLAARRGALGAEQESLDALLRAQRSRARVLLDAHRIWVPPGHEREQADESPPPETE